MDTTELRRLAIDTLLRTSRQDRDAATIADETPLKNGGLGINSLALLQAFVAIENRFGMTFDDAAVANANLATVGEFVNLIREAVCIPTPSTMQKG